MDAHMRKVTPLMPPWDRKGEPLPSTCGHVNEHTGARARAPPLGGGDVGGGGSGGSGDGDGGGCGCGCVASGGGGVGAPIL